MWSIVPTPLYGSGLTVGVYGDNMLVYMVAAHAAGPRQNCAIFKMHCVDNSRVASQLCPCNGESYDCSETKHLVGQQVLNVDAYFSDEDQKITQGLAEQLPESIEGVLLELLQHVWSMWQMLFLLKPLHLHEGLIISEVFNRNHSHHRMTLWQRTHPLQRHNAESLLLSKDSVEEEAIALKDKTRKTLVKTNSKPPLLSPSLK